MRVLLCEPFSTGSHRAWAHGLAAHSRHDIRVVEHRGAFWKWRMQGGALTLADAIHDVVAGWGRPDVVLVSDMVHLPALLGFARHDLGPAPVVLYLHENQLTYPLQEGVAPDHTYAMTSWLNVAVADAVVFNSEHHRRDLLEHLPAFLDRFPDHRHTRFLAGVDERVTVLPVGIDADRLGASGRRSGPPIVLWNHRWEHDKDPDSFVAALDAVEAAGVPFRVAVAGERFATVPPALADLEQRCAGRLVHYGTASPEEYPALLGRADVVVSTARHEFFGVAVVEAMAAGAAPVLPRRLSYPELVPADVADEVLYDGTDELAGRLCQLLADGDARRRLAASTTSFARTFDWRQIAPRYDDLLDRVAAAGNATTGNATDADAPAANATAGTGPVAVDGHRREPADPTAVRSSADRRADT